MSDIAIYGAGGFGREVALMIEQINTSVEKPWNIIGYYDDNLEKGHVVDGFTVLGKMDDLNALTGTLAVVIAIADPIARRNIRDNIKTNGLSFPTLIHPSAQLGDVRRNSIGQGVLITAGNILTTGIRIMDFAIINLSCTIGHDVTIGSFSTVMPGCSISGSVRIGPMVMVGSGARILPGISIGDKSRVGAGAVLLENVPAGATVVGVPGRIVRRG